MSTLLSTMVNQQNLYQTLQQVPEEIKVGFIDQALKNETVDYKFPFRRRKYTLKILLGRQILLRKFVNNQELSYVKYNLHTEGALIVDI